MKLKDFMFWTMMLLTVSLCSCSDSEDNDIPAEEKQVATSLNMKVELEMCEDLFTVADVYLGYINANGEQVSEKLNSPKVSKDIVVPLSKAKTVGYCVILQSKKLEAHEVERYTVGVNTNQVMCCLLDQHENVMSVSSSGTATKLSVGANDIEDYLARNVVLLEYGCEVSSENKLVEGTINWGFF